MCRQAHTPAHLHTRVCPCPWRTLVHARTRSSRDLSPGRPPWPRDPITLGGTPCYPHPVHLGHTCWAGASQPHDGHWLPRSLTSLRAVTRGAPAGSAQALEWTALRPLHARALAGGQRLQAGLGQGLEPPPLLLTPGPGSRPPLFLRVLGCFCVLLAPTLSPHVGFI